MSDLKIIRNKNQTLQLYAQGIAPSRDYHGLLIHEKDISLITWKVSYGPHPIPKQQTLKIDDFQFSKSMQDEVKNLYGPGVLDYIQGLSLKWKKLENFPAKIFLYLMSFLNLQDMLNLMCCSKIMHELCNQEEVWKLMFMKKFQRIPSKQELMMAMDFSWKDVFKKRLLYVRVALKNAQESKMLAKKTQKGMSRGRKCKS